MKKVKIKANAKINLTLDVLGVEGGFHKINSLVASINLSDAITLRKRKDKQVTLNMKGIKIDCEKEKNTAYLSALSFINKFNTLGVDVIINKKIALGGGLGGSSSDVAGVLNGMKKLYNINGDVKDIADSIGSDCGYMLDGGYAVISGRGEKVQSINAKKTFYILLATSKKCVLARESYKEFDRQNKFYPECTKKAVEYLKSEKTQEFFACLKNDLYDASSSLVKEIKQTVDKMSEHAKTLMTGSGSAVYSIFESKKERQKAYKKLKKIGLKTKKLKTIY